METRGIVHQLRQDAEALFYAGIRAVDPEAAVRRCCRVDGGRFVAGTHIIDLDKVENIFVVGAGKATAPMAAALEELLGERITSGVISVKYGHTARLRRVRTVEAGHPIPDENGRRAAKHIVAVARRAGENDLIICLISGGGSALLPLPAGAITLPDKQTTVELLIGCGADIHQINRVRKHISAVKGGWLAREAFPAAMISLVLSDVIGDDLDIIASGPTVGDPSTYREAMRVIEDFQLAQRLPPVVLAHLRSGEAGQIAETPKPGDETLQRARALIVGRNLSALSAAGELACRRGYRPLILSSTIEGDTREAALFHAAIAGEIRRSANPVPAPACLLSGGETTVRLAGRGKGGRNQEFSLAVARAIAGMENTLVLSAGTDGSDGPTDAAGAFADGGTLTRAAACGLNPDAFLADNDAYHFFEKLGDLFITGPTRTNVMDLRIVLIGKSDPAGGPDGPTICEPLSGSENGRRA